MRRSRLNRGFAEADAESGPPRSGRPCVFLCHGGVVPPNNVKREVALESTLFGYTAKGQLHTLSLWFILALRLMIGLAFLQSGVDKVLGGEFSAGGYLQNAPPANGSPVADLFVAMGETPWFVDFVNVAVPGARC